MTGKELASWYRAAVEFIDPKLPEDCPVEDICAAARARQRALSAHNSETARSEYSKIEEVLEFIRRAHPAVSDVLGTSSAASVSEESVAPQHSAPDAAPAVEHEPQNGNGIPADGEPGLAIAQDEPQPGVPAADTEEPESVLAQADMEVPAGAPVADPAGAATETGSAVPGPAGSGENTLPEPAPVEMATVDVLEELPVSEVQAQGQDAAALAAAVLHEDGNAAAPLSRHQYIEGLQARRDAGTGLLEAEKQQLLQEIEKEQHTSEKVEELLASVPDVQQKMDEELQREEQALQPLDFRSMMSQASSRELPVRPVRRPRLSTEEILARRPEEHHIPEEAAAPVLLGMLLISWQFSTALLAGFALCRLLVWPFGTAFSSMQPLRALLACLLGLGSAALIGAWFRNYRLRSHRLSLPVHVTALSMLLLLLSWQLKSAGNAYAAAPPLWLWCMLFAAWLVATIAAGIHDLRVPPVQRKQPAGTAATKPAAPLAG